jgi:hypothetical protein
MFIILRQIIIVVPHTLERKSRWVSVKAWWKFITTNPCRLSLSLAEKPLTIWL